MREIGVASFSSSDAADNPRYLWLTSPTPPESVATETCCSTSPHRTVRLPRSPCSMPNSRKPTSSTRSVTFDVSSSTSILIAARLPRLPAVPADSFAIGSDRSTETVSALSTFTATASLPSPLSTEESWSMAVKRYSASAPTGLTCDAVVVTPTSSAGCVRCRRRAVPSLQPEAAAGSASTQRSPRVLSRCCVSLELDPAHCVRWRRRTVMPTVSFCLCPSVCLSDSLSLCVPF